MSNLRVNNVNIGGTSVAGVIQQVDSQGTPNTAGNKITLNVNGTNNVSGDTSFNDALTCFSTSEFNNTATFIGDAEFSGSTATKYIKFSAPATNINTVDYYGGETVTISSVTATGGGGIVTIINSGSTAVTINKSAALTIHIGTGVVTASSLSLAQYGMCTIYAINTGTWISGVGLS
jgi:hypothetical protein